MQWEAIFPLNREVIQCGRPVLNGVPFLGHVQQGEVQQLDGGFRLCPEQLPLLVEIHNRQYDDVAHVDVLGDGQLRRMSLSDPQLYRVRPPVLTLRDPARLTPN